MLITLWVFIGVEGAVVVSARARNKRDVGKATLLAVLSALGVYLLVTLLSLGVVARPELAEIRNPSMAGLMVEMMGPWGRNHHRCRFDRFRLRRVLKLDHHGGRSSVPRLPLIKHSHAFLRARTHKLRHPPHCG